MSRARYVWIVLYGVGEVTAKEVKASFTVKYELLDYLKKQNVLENVSEYGGKLESVWHVWRTCDNTEVKNVTQEIIEHLCKELANEIPQDSGPPFHWDV
jgi:hypothetical protein